MTIENVLICFLCSCVLLYSGRKVESQRWSRQILLLWKLGNTYIPFSKIFFLMLTESNSKNFLSEIITKNLEKLLMKFYRFQWNFSLQVLSQCLYILNQTLSYNFFVISQRALLRHSICCVLMYIHIHYYLYEFWVCSIFLLAL